MEDTEQRGSGIKNGLEWSKGTVHFDRTGPTEKSGPPRKVDWFFRNFFGWTEPIHSVLDPNFRKLWLNGSRPVYFICSRSRSLRKQLYFNCICWFGSSRDRKGQSDPVKYYLESVEEYSEGKIHKSEPEQGNGNVNSVYFVNQARGNTRISCTDRRLFTMNQHSIANVYLYLSFLLRIMFVKNILLQISFYV